MTSSTAESATFLAANNVARIQPGFWMRPVSNQVIVQRRKERRRRSVVLHEVKAAEAPHEGEVMAVGPDVRIPVKLGDVLMFTRFAGQEGTAPLASDVEYVILAESEVLCVLDDAALKALEDAEVAKEQEASARLRDLRAASSKE